MQQAAQIRVLGLHRKCYTLHAGTLGTGNRRPQALHQQASAPPLGCESRQCLLSDRVHLATMDMQLDICTKMLGL